MGELFSDILFSIFGRIYMLIRYRDNEKRSEHLKIEYDNSYGIVGRIKFLQVFVILILFILVGGFIIPITFNLFRKTFF